VIDLKGVQSKPNAEAVVEMKGVDNDTEWRNPNVKLIARRKKLHVETHIEVKD
jgi:hypothetical protein